MARQSTLDRSRVAGTDKGRLELRLTPKETQALGALVKLAQDNLDGEGIGMRASPSSVLRALLIREAEDCGKWRNAGLPRSSKDDELAAALAIRNAARKVAADDALACRKPFGWGLDVHEEPPPWGEDPEMDMDLVLECLQQVANPTTGLAFVPSVVRAMGKGVHDALHDGARVGRWELLPGIGRIGKNDARLCRSGPDGTLLAWVRIVSDDAEAVPHDPCRQVRPSPRRRKVEPELDVDDVRKRLQKAMKRGLWKSKTEAAAAATKYLRSGGSIKQAAVSRFLAGGRTSPERLAAFDAVLAKVERPRSDR